MAPAELGLVAYVRSDLVIDTEDRGFRKGSVAAVVARDPADLGSLLREGSPWRRIEPDMKSWLWTDDYSTILSAIAAKFIR